MRPLNLEAKILEMTLAAFGAVACGGAATSGSGANVPTATEVATPATPHAAQSSCSAAGCGASLAKTDGNGEAATGDKSADNALATTPATTPAAADTSTAAPSPAADPPAATDTATKPKAKAKAHAKPGAPKAATKSADDDGCGAGSCGSK
jgi:hypothetical protein